jgi:CheY-like chemotaxis protein
MRSSDDTRDVLVVEDDDAIRELLKELLEEAGFRVIRAANGLEALASLRAGRAPRVILLDLAMPVMDGLEFRTTQRRDPSLATIPVVVMSASDGIEQRISEMQVDGYLPKPFELQALLATLNRY